MTKLVVNEWSHKVRLINDYGPTETCICASINTKVCAITDPNNIGYGYGDSTHLWVVEPANYSKLTPVGCNGELLISGPTLARGYLNDVEKTSNAFVDCSEFEWALKGDERCYATGDLVRRNGDGSITFSGRKDTQVQLHGIRIEVEEIEAVLGYCDGITLAVVDKVLQEGSDFEVLVAFLTIRGKSSQTAEEVFLRPDETIRSLINHASSLVVGRLPKCMAPTAYLPLHKIPMSTGGKIDRKALQEIYASAPRDILGAWRSNSLEKRVPRTEVQRLLQRLWGQVLGLHVNQIGLDDEFLNLGGNSLAAIKLASLSMKNGLGLSVMTIFQRAKFEDMSASINLNRDHRLFAESVDPAPFALLGGTDVKSALDDQNNLEDIVPVSSFQSSFILRAQKWHQAYYIWFFIDVDNQFSPGCLKVACNSVVQRYQILRTAFHLVGKQCYQVIRKNIEADFKTLTSTGRMDQICCQLIDQDVKVPVQFGTVLTHFRLFIDSKTGHQRLEIGLSHAQYDGFCTDAIFSDLFFACIGKPKQEKMPSYSRYLKHSIQISQSTDTDKFWAHILQDSKMTRIGQLPKTRDPPLDQSVFRVKLPNDKRPEGMTAAVVIKTAWSLVLSQISKSDDIVFSSIVSGRISPFEGATEVVGPCLNIIPVRLKLEPNLSFMSLMRQTHEQQVTMIPYESTPWSKSFGNPLGRLQHAMDLLYYIRTSRTQVSIMTGALEIRNGNMQAQLDMVTSCSILRIAGSRPSQKRMAV